jgi:hypothetical protein
MSEMRSEAQHTTQNRSGTLTNKLNGNIESSINKESSETLSISAKRKAAFMKELNGGVKFNINTVVPKSIGALLDMAFPMPSIGYGGAVRKVKALRVMAAISFNMRKGTIEELINALIDQGLNFETGKQYVFELIRKHIIVSPDGVNWVCMIEEDW